MFYDVFCELCKQRGLTPSGAAGKIGFNRASITVWKNTGKAPKQEILLKISDYFQVSTDYLLGISSRREIDVTGLDEEEILFVSQLVELLRKKKEGL